MEQRILILDIESTDLLANMLDYSSFPYKLKPDAKLWCVVIRNAQTDEVIASEKESVTKEWMQENLKGCTHLVGHNVIKFDFLVLKLFGVLDYEIGYLGKPDFLFGEEVKIIDTLILSRLLNPDRHLGHSLHSWGERLKNNTKTDFRQLCINKGYIQKTDEKGAEFKQYCSEMLTYCITPENKVLSTNLDWIEARTLKVGDDILGFDEYSEENRSGRRYKTAKVEWIDYETTDVYEVLLSSGKKIKTTKEHRWLVATPNHGGNSFKWVETQNLYTKETHKYCSKVPKLLNVWEQEFDREAGWLAGMFDGEGTITKHRFSISVAQRPTKTLEKLEYLLKSKGFNISKRFVKSNSDCQNIIMQGCAAERLEFLGKIKPHRLIDNFNFEMLGRVEARLGKEDVISVKYVGKEEIIKIQTSSKTFICEGYPMHNCIQDTSVNRGTFFALFEEMGDFKGWKKALKMENKLADLAIRRESLGFWFDKDLAVRCVEDLTEKMENLQNKVNPILPPKSMTKGELSHFTPPNTQFLKSGKPSTHIVKFAERIGAIIEQNEEEKYFINFENKRYELPFTLPLKTHTEADISNLDHVKMTLTDDYDWIPTEWSIRDLTKDSKKQSLSYEKRVTAFERWLSETMCSKYTKLRLEIVFQDYRVKTVESLKDAVKEKLKADFPVRVPTSPKVRVGVEKDLCPNLVKLGEQVEFANDFAMFLTYKHRKSSIAGGDIEDMDFDLETPNTGFLSMYREVDGRIPTPAIEIGANTHRYRHIGVCNIARPTSLYGKELRSLFGCGKNAVFYGFDYASIEARIMAHYVFNYTDGEELGKTFVAEKPNDLHTKMAEVMGVPRSEAKSINYGIIYGAAWKKIQKMTGKNDEDSKKIVDGFWNTAIALKEFKEKALSFWESTGKQYVPAIDGRKVFVRSPHSILNILFQSAAIIYAKYIAVSLMESLEKTHNLCVNPFEGKPDVCSMIEYHDEEDLYTNPNLFSFKTFTTKDEAEKFIVDWDGEQLSAIGESSRGFYVCLPNIISKETTRCMRELEQDLKLNVPMGFEYMLGRTWYDAH